jgi:T5orf172 domain
MRPRIHELLDADVSKMTPDELGRYIERFQAIKKKDLPQLISDKCEGKPEHEGFVYVLSHEAMPRLLKIGCTVGPVEKRAAEIANATGVPGPFRIEKKFPVYVSPRIIEKKVHEVLSPYRTVENREFFRLSIEDAVMFIRDVIDGRF